MYGHWWRCHTVILSGPIAEIYIWVVVSIMSIIYHPSDIPICGKDSLNFQVSCACGKPTNELSFWCTPRNLRWNLTIMVSKRTFLSRDLFSGSMQFRGCSSCGGFGPGFWKGTLFRLVQATVWNLGGDKPIDTPWPRRNTTNPYHLQARRVDSSEFLHGKPHGYCVFTYPQIGFDRIGQFADLYRNMSFFSRPS